MPHRPEGQGSASLSPGGVVNSPVSYTPPRVAGSTAAAIMRQQTTETNQKAFRGVVTPVVKQKGLNWLTASNKSCDSLDRSATDDSRSIATLATEDEREATASALLMVAKAAEREHNYLKGMVVDGGNDRRIPPAVSASASTCSASTVPLKKRKKQLDILRRQQPQEKDACHVSPVSHDSGNTASASNRTQSYDSKDLGSSVASPQGESTQELLDSAKVHSTAQIGVSQVLIPHFPTVLHQVLADTKNSSDEKGPIIRWLADGESWKVENWNAMRKQVLPRYFSDLRDENGSSCGTIDAFLHNIDAWGFEEIKTGPNAGAYCHNLFIRGAQKLSVKMRFSGSMTSEETVTNKKAPKTVSPSRSTADEKERLMLQVPMLATADSKKQQSLPPNKRPRFEGNTMGMAGHGALHWPYTNETAQGMIWGPGQMHEMANARAFGMRAGIAMNGGYASQPGAYVDPRMQLLRVPGAESMMMQRQPQQPFQYNPPQVRSGRGALRGMAAATQQNRAATPTSTSPSFRHGFPVSNRGKGSRKAALNRTHLKTKAVPKTPEASKTASPVSLAEAQLIGSSVKGGVAVAISRKTKRKLPMARKLAEDENAAV